VKKDGLGIKHGDPEVQQEGISKSVRKEA